MKKLSIDIETFSPEDIAKAGSYRYINHKHFKILLFAYAYDDDPVEVIDLAQGESIPEKIIEDLKDPKVMKCAFNDNFERIALSKYLYDREYHKDNEPIVEANGEIKGRVFSANFFGADTFLPREQWECTMIKCLSLGLPGSLKGVCDVLGFGENGKMTEGKALIKFFCTPKFAKGMDKANALTADKWERNLPSANIDKWNLFKEYNRRDVEVERKIRKIVDNYPLPKKEWDIRFLDQKINDRGVMLDGQLAKQAIELGSTYSVILLNRAKELTGLENPNSVAQLKSWVSGRLNQEIPTLRKLDIENLLEEALPEDVREALEIRLKLGKTSNKKYETMGQCVCNDLRMHGLLQHYGANRTGRWAGRLVQVQNLPQNKIEELEEARTLVKDGTITDIHKKIDKIETNYGKLPFILSQLIRTAFIPGGGRKFLVADFSAIEARVIAWLAKEDWRLEVFKNNGDIYCSSASKMFKVPVEKHGVNGHLRPKGKIAELALGYGGAVGALKAMDRNKDLTEDEMVNLVRTWRDTNPKIVNMWWEIDKTAKEVIKHKSSKRLDKYNLTFTYTHQLLRIKLPSGRCLTYCKPKVELEPGFNRESITYMGVNQTTKKWEKIYTYGPKLVENIVQGIARDCLAEAMLNVDNRGYDIVMHVHDEIIAEVLESDKDKTLEKMIDLMCIVPDWATGLPLKADGYPCKFYKKD